MFKIRMGIPGMDALWRNLTRRYDQGILGKDEARDFKRLTKALGYLQANPRHPGLGTHEIEPLSRRHGFKIWQSYLENNTPAAGRLFWAYGPHRGEITILAIEPHPEDAKRGAYDRINLSVWPDD